MGYINIKTFDLFYKVWNKGEMRKRSEQYVNTYLEHSGFVWDIDYKEPYPFTNDEGKDGYRQFVVIRAIGKKE